MEKAFWMYKHASLTSATFCASEKVLGIKYTKSNSPFWVKNSVYKTLLIGYKRRQELGKGTKMTEILCSRGTFLIDYRLVI